MNFFTPLLAVFLLGVVAPRAQAQTPSLVRLPPQITGASQSAEQVPAGGTSRLSVTASDPQGSALTFTWSSTAGSLGASTNTATTSAITWTAPDCLAPDAGPVMITVRNAYGLSTSAVFDFTVTGNLAADVQPAFTASGFEQLQNVEITSTQALRYRTAQAPLNPARIIFPEDKRVSLSYVSEIAGGSHTLGWMYADDLWARGYIDANGDLVDSNNNGVMDLHEDLYNLAPAVGTQARPYIGVLPRRCSQTFVSGGYPFSLPELAADGACTNTFAAQRQLLDARPGNHHTFMSTDLVGAFVPTSPGTGFSDRGLYPTVPNLLEPAHASNGNLGLGHLVFLLSDDDYGRDSFKQLGPVADVGDFMEGIPDYDVSAYDAHGLRRAVNPDPGISAYDRTVDLGVIQGGREIVFFLIAYFDMNDYGSGHDPSSGTVYPCLRKEAGTGRCLLHLKSSMSVYFSKAQWNLDQDPRANVAATGRHMGCAYEPACDPLSPGTTYSCAVGTTTQRLCGWLDEDTQAFLNSPAHGNLVLPSESTSVPTAAANGNMAHVVFGAPSTTPGQWIFGFEDLSGGGDRDFNDVVFRLQAASTGAGGLARSKVLNRDASCKVSRVRFRTQDQLGTGCGTSPSPIISYGVATDCRVCSGGTCSPNPTPSWVSLSLPSGQNELYLDFSSYPGTQLCWRAVLNSAAPTCLPSVLNVDVGYESTPVTP